MGFLDTAWDWTKEVVTLGAAGESGLFGLMPPGGGKSQQEWLEERRLAQGGTLPGAEGAEGGGYDVDQITSQIQTLLDTGTDPAIEAEYRMKLGEGYRDAEMGAASRGVTGYGGVQRSKTSVRREADIAKSRAAFQQKQMNQQLAIQWTQQLLNRKQLSQEGAFAMSEIQLGGADWILQNRPAMGKYIPGIQEKVAKYIEKNPNDYMGAATLYSQLFNEALAKTDID